MARTDGFGRGALHGTLIGAAALAALSLALPLPESGGVPASGTGEPAAAIPATHADGTDTVQTQAATAEAQPGLAETTAEGTGDTVPEGSSDVTEAEPAGTEDASAQPMVQSDDTPQDAAPVGDGLATQLSPVPGSEFARAEDLPPTVPAASSVPMTQGQVGAVLAPSAESAPVPATSPADRPDAQNLTEIPQVREDRQTALSAPATELSLPPTPAAPAPLNDPGQDAGPTPASRAAPVAPDEAEATSLPGREDSPQTPAISRPAEPDAPVPVTLPEAARPAPPGLPTPDPSRETVPPPPEAASLPVETPVESPAAQDAAQPAPTGQGRPAPDLHIPTLPSLP